MSDGEAIVISASVLVDPLVGARRTLQLLDELEDVLGAYLPRRATVVLDFTDASDSGDIGFWWHHRVLYPGFHLIVNHARESRTTAVRQAWVLDHNRALGALVKNADRVRSIVMEPGDDHAWTHLMDEIRDYAALIAG